MRMFGGVQFFDTVCGYCGDDCKWPDVSQIFPNNQSAQMARPVCNACNQKQIDEAYRGFGYRRTDPGAIMLASNAPFKPARKDPRVRGWIASDRAGLYLFGPAGEYKTTIAVNLMREWAESERRACHYFSEAELFRMLSDWDGERKGAFAKALYVPLLVIDDLGTGKRTERTTADFFEIIDKRETAGRRTIFVSNYKLDELRRPSSDGGGAKIDDRVAVRIARMCVGQKLISGLSRQ